MSSTPSAFQAENSWGAQVLAETVTTLALSGHNFHLIYGGLQVRVTASILPPIEKLTRPIVLSALGSGLYGPAYPCLFPSKHAGEEWAGR